MHWFGIPICGIFLNNGECDDDGWYLFNMSNVSQKKLYLKNRSVIRIYAYTTLYKYAHLRQMCRLTLAYIHSHT